MCVHIYVYIYIYIYIYIYTCVSRNFVYSGYVHFTSPLPAYGAHDLYDVVDFDAWYSTHLVKELEIVAPR